MKIVAGALLAFLLDSALISTEAEAGCWWNGYNRCRYYHPAWHPWHPWHLSGTITVTGTVKP
jgi:hypothetical protein